MQYGYALMVNGEKSLLMILFLPGMVDHVSLRLKKRMFGFYYLKKLMLKYMVSFLLDSYKNIEIGLTTDALKNLTGAPSNL